MAALKPEYGGKSVLVVGAARSGLAAAEFLLRHGARVVLTDNRKLESLQSVLEPLTRVFADTGRLTLELGSHNPETFRTCDLVVVSPGVPLSLPCFEESRKAKAPVIGEVELAWRHLKGQVLGITGSNGKTTTTTLVAELLKGAGLKGYAAGNIGRPLISLVETSTAEDIYSTELSSFQLEGIDQFRPRVGAILNLTPDHLDRYPGIREYYEAKRRIFLNQNRSDFAVLNADDPLTADLAATVHSTPVLFSRKRDVALGAFVRNGRVLYRDGAHETNLFSVADIRLRGAHNLENVLAACAITALSGARPDSFAATVHGFAGVEHRLEWVEEIDGVQYFNDSKATNVDAAIKSLEAFPGNICLIAGGYDKGGDFGVLRALVEERVKHLVLIGKAADKMRAALSDCTAISEAKSLEEAVLIGSRVAGSGDVVLLAPACASFDMFQDYEERGRKFKDAVYELKRNSPRAEGRGQ